MARILICDGMEQSTVVELKQLGHEVVEHHYEPAELKVQAKDFDVMIVRSATKVTKEIIDGALETKRLKVIIRGGVGIDNIDAVYAKENGIAVNNTPSASSRAVAELTIAHMFSLARFLYQSSITMNAGLWEKKKYEGVELAGKTLGLIGLGRIGQETGKIAAAIGMKVIYFTRSGKKEGFDEFTYVPLETIYEQSDFISIHMPMDKEKGPLIGANEIAKMKDGVFLVNCSRGGIIVEEALLDALDSGKVAAAALDVFEQEPTKNQRLYTHDKVSLSPHIGASTIEAQQKIGKEIVEIITKAFA